MQIADTTRFVVGIVFLLLAIALFVRARGQKGFGQIRQAALLSLVAAIIFIAMGLGLGRPEL